MNVTCGSPNQSRGPAFERDRGADAASEHLATSAHSVEADRVGVDRQRQGACDAQPEDLGESPQDGRLKLRTPWLMTDPERLTPAE
jgi:hypothetical protein